MAVFATMVLALPTLLAIAVYIISVAKIRYIQHNYCNIILVTRQEHRLLKSMVS